MSWRRSERLRLLRALRGRESEDGGSRLGPDLPKEKYLRGSGTNGNGFRLAGSAAGFGSPPIALSTIVVLKQRGGRPTASLRRYCPTGSDDDLRRVSSGSYCDPRKREGAGWAPSPSLGYPPTAVSALIWPLPLNEFEPVPPWQFCGAPLSTAGKKA